jgi:hypothetical protein
MTKTQALQIVLDLARQNVIDDPEMSDMEHSQREAIGIIEKVVLKEYQNESLRREYLEDQENYDGC